MSNTYNTSFYDQFYSPDSPKRSELVRWRLLSARSKAQNISKLCPDLSLLNNILEVGSGTGELAYILHSSYATPRVHISDISSEALSTAVQLYSSSIVSTTTLLPGATLPFLDDEFDLVYCSHVLEHVADISMFLSELLRIGRRVYIEVPLDYRHYYIPTKALLSCGHIHAFSNSTIKFYIEQSGATILASGTSFIQHQFPISNFHPLAQSTSLPFLKRLLTLLLLRTRWLLIFLKLRIRALLGTYGTEAFFLIRK